MKTLWEFPDNFHSILVGTSLSKYGSLIGELSSPHSSIFTFDRGIDTGQRYIVAKGIRLHDSMSLAEKKMYLSRALYEVNNARLVCHHPLIHRFFDVQVVYGIPFLLSRKRDATLRDVIAEGPLGECEAISIAVQILHGLNYCASKGLVCHQDLKPENVFVDFIGKHFSVPADYPLRGRVFVADFELANAYLMLRHPYGSRPYMAPEQYQKLDVNKPPPDFSRVDVFALGVILCEMLTGGIHPIGEHISLIWPMPAAGQSKKWSREDPWKKWLSRGAKASAIEDRVSSQMFQIIEACLKTDASERIAKDQLELRLLKCLHGIDEHAHRAVTLMLEDFDNHSREGEDAGWPYYEDRVKQLNAIFSDEPLP